jgi:hypothetical protein
MTLALFVCAATTAFCQSSAPAPINPDTLGQLTPEFTQPGMDFSQLPPNWNLVIVKPRGTLVLPRTAAGQLRSSAAIDPKIIVHPPQSSLGVQPPGTLVAQNLYPNLQLLPIDWPKAKIEQIPTQWPNYKLARIPTEWKVKAVMRLVQNGNRVGMQDPAK